MNKVKNKILEKVKKGEVHQKSPFYFIVKNYFFWIMFGTSILVGALAFSSFLVHFIIEPGPWHKLILEQQNFYYLVKALPLIWFILIIIFIFVAWFNYKNTNRAYKKHNFLIVSVSVVISIFLGMILFLSGMGRDIDQRMQKQLPFYGKYSNERKIERIKYLESLGINPEEFMKQRRLKSCENRPCGYRNKETK